jgi:hypothetical protein
MQKLIPIRTLLKIARNPMLARNLSGLEKQVIADIKTAKTDWIKFKQSKKPMIIGVPLPPHGLEQSEEESNAFWSGRKALTNTIRYYTGDGKVPLTRRAVLEIRLATSGFHPEIRLHTAKRILGVCTDWKLRIDRAAEKQLCTEMTKVFQNDIQMALAKDAKVPKSRIRINWTSIMTKDAMGGPVSTTVALINHNVIKSRPRRKGK